MWLRRRAGVVARAALAGVIAGALGASPAPPPQSPEVLMPAESAAKARELIQQAIRALGGPAYQGVRDATCTGRFATFDRTEGVGGYAKFVDYVKLPDKNRTEFYKQRNIVTVFNGDQGWELDRGGVQDAPPASVEQFQEGLKKDIDILFRFRLDEEGLVFRYAGSDLLDLKRVDWVEIVDRDRRTTRIALDQGSHLPVRAVSFTRDPQTRERTEEAYFFSNYHSFQGVMTPLQIWRERDGRMTLQVFYQDCKYNTGLNDALFTRASLEQHFAALRKGKKK